MLRRCLIALALVAPALAATAASAQSTTTRIESRPYYGAVVTLEQGVRVWRPLPPTGHMIINPTNAPIYLNIADVRDSQTSNNYNYNNSYDRGGDVPVVGAPIYGRPFHHRHHQRFKRHRPGGYGLGPPRRR